MRALKEKGSLYKWSIISKLQENAYIFLLSTVKMRGLMYSG